MTTIYLDNAATTQIHPAVLDAMMPYLTGEYFNPSSQYSPALHEKQVLETCRTYLAQTIGAKPSEIRFTSGGTESDNWALKGIAQANAEHGKHVVVSAIEHPAVLESAKWLERNGFEVSQVPVTEEGIVTPEVLAEVMRPDTVLVSIMAANNETGLLQPIRELSQVAHEAGALLHTDAVQVYGKMPLSVTELGVDALSISAHKFHGPKGVGFLYCKRGMAIEPLLNGGAQERGYRAGTENVAGIVGMTAAAALAYGNAPASLNFTADAAYEVEQATAYEQALSRQLEEGILAIPESRINGGGAQRLAGVVSASFKGISSEALLLLLDQEGICASAGSACASGSLEPSHVLQAMGVDDEWASGTIRFSLSAATTAAEIERTLTVLTQSVQHLRSV